MKHAILVILLAGALCGCGDVETLRTVTVASTKNASLALREVPVAKLRSMQLRYGLAVVEAGDAAERAGLRVGDVVYGVEQSRIASLEEFYRLVSHRHGGPLALLVRRANADLYVTIDFSSGSPDGNRARDTLLRT